MSDRDDWEFSGADAAGGPEDFTPPALGAFNIKLRFLNLKKHTLASGQRHAFEESRIPVVAQETLSPGEGIRTPEKAAMSPQNSFSPQTSPFFIKLILTKNKRFL